METDNNKSIIDFNKSILPGFGQALLLILIVALLSTVFQYVIMLVAKEIHMAESWSLFLSYVFTFAFVLFVAKKWWHSGGFETSKVSTGIYILFIPMIIALSIVMDGVVSLIPMPERIQELFESMVHLDTAGYLTVGIAAPILEELIFRGVILKLFLQKYSVQKAIIYSALIFGIVHMNPWQFIPAFVIGIVIGWIYYRTKSIFPGIFIHFINNSLSFAVAVKFKNINTTIYDLIGNTTLYIALIVMSLLVIYTVLIVLKKYFERKEISV